MSPSIPFEEDVKPAMATEHVLNVHLDGFEGPIDLLLHLAREHKIDLAQLSILELARQYIKFIDEAVNLKLEIAADYLVMAAWLAFLKSRLLLPQAEQALDGEEEDDAHAMAQALAKQLLHLETLQGLTMRLMARPKLGVDKFHRGAPEGLKRYKNIHYIGNLYDLLRAYGDMAQRRQPVKIYKPIAHKLMAVEDAKNRLVTWIARVLGKPRGDVWLPLDAFLPVSSNDGLSRRGQRVAFFTAGLELAKQGAIDLKQDKAFAPLMMRARKEERA